MSITTERRVTAAGPDVGQSTITHRGSTRRPAVRTRSTLERRRHVYATSPQGRARHHEDTHFGATCIETAPERISWAATVLGIIATAAVLLGFVAVANLRAESIDASQISDASQITVVEQGFGTVEVTEGQTPLTPAVAGQ